MAEHDAAHMRARYRNVRGLEGHAEREGEIEKVPVTGLPGPRHLDAALVVVGGGASALGGDSRAALLIGFDVAAFIFLCSLAPLLKADPEQMRCTAEQNDANRAGLLAITVLLSLVILFAVGTLIASPGALDRAKAPTSLSRALCRPTSSRAHKMSPPGEQKAAAWTAPVARPSG